LRTKKVEESDVLDFSAYEKELKMLDDRYEPLSKKKQPEAYPTMPPSAAAQQHSTKEGTSPQMFDHLDTLKTFD